MKIKEDLAELTTSEEEFFIDLTWQNSFITFYTLLSEIVEGNNFYGFALIFDIKVICTE